MLIIRELMLGPLRFTDLLLALPGMGTRMLTERLKHLADQDIVGSRSLPPPAASVCYALTDRGAALGPVLAELAAWGRPLVASCRRDDHRTPATAALMLWQRAGRMKRRSLGDLQVTISDTPFVFQARGGCVKARRGELPAPDGQATASSADVFALLDGSLDVRRAVSGGRLEVAGVLSADAFGELFDLGRAA